MLGKEVKGLFLSRSDFSSIFAMVYDESLPCCLTLSSSMDL